MVYSCMRKHTKVRNMISERQNAESVTAYESSLLFFMLIAFIRSIYGVITSTSADVAVVSGAHVRLQCSTNTTDDLLWYRLIPGAGSEDHIVEGSTVNDKFRHFYSVQQVNQESNLSIAAEQSTAGRYACVEMFTNERASAQLTVLQSEPSCSGSVIGNFINLTCIVVFSGHGNPIVTWTRITGNETTEITFGIETIQSSGPLITLTSTLTVQEYEKDKNHLLDYNYTVKFCEATYVTKVTYGGLCVYSWSLSTYIDLGEEINGTTSKKKWRWRRW